MSDLISRTWLLDVVENIIEWDTERDRNRIIHQVRELTPAAQPRKKGKWIEFDSDEDKYDLIKCSCCEHIFTVDSFHWSDRGFVKDDFNFCPICGASMKGESE